MFADPTWRHLGLVLLTIALTILVAYLATGQLPVPFPDIPR